MADGDVLEGCFAIHKPTTISSAQVLRNIQTHFNPSKLFAPLLAADLNKRHSSGGHGRKFRRREKRPQVKIGHGGTLDPLATGVLICGIGEGTKSLSDFLACTKTYECVVLFGAATDTYDRVGQVVARAETGHVTEDVVRKALDKFRGKIKQLPPLYSALKMGGKPLYEYARSGQPLPREIELRDVEVQELEMIKWMDGGTHDHRAPEESASKEVGDLAKGVWNKADVAPGRQMPFAWEKGSKKRKVDVAAGSESVDDLVVNRPPSKRGNRAERASNDDEMEPVMSGGLEAENLDVEDTSEVTMTEDEVRSVRPEHGDDAQVEPQEAATNGEVAIANHSGDGEPNKAESDAPETKASAEATSPPPPPSTEPQAQPQPQPQPQRSSSLKITTPSSPPSPSSSPPPPPSPPAAIIRLTVTSGFYVRSFCHDLGAAVDSAALMAELVRTRQGAFTLGRNVLAYEDLERGEHVWGPKVRGYLEDWRVRKVGV